MLLIYIAALFGIFRFRGIEYWKWFSILFVWMLGMQLLFSGGGTLDNPSGDGFITHQIRIATNDGPGMGIFAIAFIIVYWGVAIWLLRKMYVLGTRLAKARLDREAESGDEVTSGRKLGEAVGATVIAAIYIFFVFILPRMTTDAAPSMTAGADVTSNIRTVAASQSGNEDPIAVELAKGAAEANEEVPKRLDQITILESVTSAGRTLTYNYRISRRDGTDEQLRRFVREHAVSSACKNTTMFTAMKDYGVTYRYSYMMPNADKPVVVEATFAVCQSLGLVANKS